MTYQDTEIVGYWIKSLFIGDQRPEQVVCSDCWEKTSDLDWRRVLDITFADTAEGDMVCFFCHLQLPTRGEP